MFLRPVAPWPHLPSPGMLAWLPAVHIVPTISPFILAVGERLFCLCQQNLTHLLTSTPDELG